MSFYRDQLENWLSGIEVKADRVLDVGGKDLPVKGRTKTWEVNKTYAVLDLPEYDLNDYGGSDEADIVFCLEVMEYIHNPVRAMENLYDLLKFGGTLYITFQFIYPWHKPVADDCLRYTRSGVVKLLKDFKMVKIQERFAKYPDKLLDFYKSGGMHVGGDSIVTGFMVKARKL